MARRLVLVRANSATLDIGIAVDGGPMDTGRLDGIDI
jgi:hypothetical protein